MTETTKQLIDKYGVKIAFIVANEIINEYDTNICNCGYEYDYDMWNAKKEDWIKIKTEIHSKK